ncbi:acetone monooxygenase [Panacagrimonas perspica]|uniref:Acetone monooxygenase n=1 Tax=Panacagrimonas perspica TaxID=381431 RepID=A0A4R7PEU3_9GAMM|nr:NAD(P)/FAD-dependent oxidoreductase [Panacagrimonas perspica]TDU31830.1 acetone monooxygenase [Panacagrimonas perspica]THD02963.1 cyclohexanone monooxygenase [Panacagrimonas perspica]
MTASVQAGETLDALIIGAGFTGLYQLWSLRKLGLKVQVLETAPDVGGTWYWNCYPGARTDSPSNIYQYWFSDDLLDEWNWNERYAGRAESHAYFRHVADRFELRKDIRFNTRVDAAHWDEATSRWNLRTQDGTTLSARFLITALGPLSAPLVPPFKGHETFKGQLVHTARWPREGIDLKGKRVGVIGTGATGIQVIQSIAAEVSHLTVFQRTANYAVPMHNKRYTDADRAAIRARYPETREAIWTTFVGFDEPSVPHAYFDLPPAERRATLEKLWADGSLKIWVAGFMEIFFDLAASQEISEFVREKIRARIHDSKVAAKLVPQDHGFGTRRVPLENGYFEIYNRDNVSLVDLHEAPIECFTPKGIRTSAGEIELDVIILATGFDAGTGGLTAIDIRGRDGVSLRQQWKSDVRTTMGLQIHGYPNLFTTSAPYAPAAAFCNAPTCLQHQVQWITDCIAYLGKHGRTVIEPSADTESAWLAHHDELAGATLVAKTRSWYTGGNIEGKPNRLLSYIGGVPAYREACEKVKEKDYEGFELA